MKLSLTFLSAAALALAACGTTQAQSEGHGGETARDMAAFPAAAPGQTRHVIRLPAQSDEDALKVEIIVGRTMRVDCNRHVLSGALETRTAQGWGYDYYVVSSLGVGASTMMACPTGSEHDEFVAMPQQALVRYNSRLPLVIYAPEDAEVRYRLWRAGEVQAAR